MKFLVTGGCGFIGSHFVRLLLKKYQDAKVVNLDLLTYAGNRSTLKDVEGKYEFVHGDVCDRATAEKCMEGADVVVHFAAETHVDRSIINAGSFVTTDVVGTYRLLEAARKQGVKKFVHISTDEVYGSIDEGKFREGDPLEPNSPYSASKAGGELLARSYFITHGLPVVIARSSNNYGPYQHPEKFIPLFVTNLLRGKKIPLYGDGSNVRDWLFVEDNCRAIAAVMDSGKDGEVYNVGGDCEKTNIEVTRSLLEILGMDEDRIDFVEDRKGHDYRYALDSRKVRALGWKPETGFDSGLRKTVDWYRQNEWWWKPLVVS